MTFLRHPVERWCSWIQYGKSNATYEYLAGHVERRPDNFLVRMFDDTVKHRAPVTEDNLERAKRVLEQFDVVLTTEILRKDTERAERFLSQQLGWTEWMRRRVNRAQRRVLQIPTCRLDKIPRDVAARIEAKSRFDMDLYRFAADKAARDVERSAALVSAAGVACPAMPDAKF